MVKTVRKARMQAAGRQSIHFIVIDHKDFKISLFWMTYFLDFQPLCHFWHGMCFDLDEKLTFSDGFSSSQD